MQLGAVILVSLWVIGCIGLIVEKYRKNTRNKNSSAVHVSQTLTPSVPSGPPKCARCHKPFVPAQYYYRYCPSCYRLKKLGVVNSPLDKMSGAEFEVALYHAYENMGYDVELTPASGDHGADLIITRGNGKVAIQAKHYNPKNVVGNSAVQQVFTAKSLYHCDQAWVVTNAFFSKQAKEEADKLGVRLIDRNELQRTMPQLFERNTKRRTSSQSIKNDINLPNEVLSGQPQRDGMSDSGVNSERIIVRCRVCNTKNRVKVVLKSSAICSVCGTKLIETEV
jgi:hypothetical protein